MSPEYYDREALTYVGNRIGETIKVDINTASHLRGHYARICVLVDLDQQLMAGCVPESETEMRTAIQMNEEQGCSSGKTVVQPGKGDADYRDRWKSTTGIIVVRDQKRSKKGEEGKRLGNEGGTNMGDVRDKSTSQKAEKRSSGKKGDTSLVLETVTRVVEKVGEGEEVNGHGPAPVLLIGVRFRREGYGRVECGEDAMGLVPLGRHLRLRPVSWALELLPYGGRRFGSGR
ncbi:hypothetical protein K1719_033986 [Acacia pycnantha]|nr:hypothetical protein K1719_033986 [Acacia pycnantha]